MADRIKNYASFIALGAMTLVMIIFPAPFCFDCEGFAPYGIDTSVVAHIADNIATFFWLVVVLAGLFKLKYSWVIPPGFFIADVLTQHLAGVPWWTLRQNEGPFIFFGDLVVGFLLLAFGFLCRQCFEWLRYKPKQSLFKSPFIDSSSLKQSPDVSYQTRSPAQTHRLVAKR